MLVNVRVQVVIVCDINIVINCVRLNIMECYLYNTLVLNNLSN